MSNGSPKTTFIDTNGDPIECSTLSTLIAEHGSASSTTWLEHDRYFLWRPSQPIPTAPFSPLQGFLKHPPYVFAWGNPIVGNVPDMHVLLRKTAEAFVHWAADNRLSPVWCCVDRAFEHILGCELGWSTLSCIHEDVVDPTHVVHLAAPDHHGREAKDLKKNLRRAEREGIVVHEVKEGEWQEKDRKEVQAGVEEWKRSKAGKLASSSLYPWLDSEHRRYWVARKDDTILGLLILTPIKNHAYVVKSAISFTSAPKGTSEELIYTAVKDLQSLSSLPSTTNNHHPYISPRDTTSPSSGSTHPSHSSEVHSISPSPSDEVHGADSDEHPSVTFGISASENLEPGENLSGWKVTWVAKTYSNVAQVAGLKGRREFRSKFDSHHEQMYVCYPQDGFGLDGLNALLKTLHK